MGFRDLIPGISSSSRERVDNESVSVQQLYLATPDPTVSLDSYRLLLGPDKPGKKSGLAVYRCTEDRTYVPAETRLYVFESGNMVQINSSPYQLHLAQIVQPDDVEKDEYNGSFMKFPEELTEVRIREQYHISDEEFEMALISIADLDK